MGVFLFFFSFQRSNTLYIYTIVAIYKLVNSEYGVLFCLNFYLLILMSLSVKQSSWHIVDIVFREGFLFEISAQYCLQKNLISFTNHFFVT